jgi:glyoxylase-like metal-dependent hydrolase (beta-lactamase superfamily II)
MAMAVVILTICLFGSMVPAGQALEPTGELEKRGLAAGDFPRLTPLAGNVYAYQAVHVEGEITTNSLIVTTPEGVVVVDGQGTIAQVRDMLGEIRKLSHKAVKYVIVASPHPEHTGGNAAFPADVTFVTSESVMLTVGEKHVLSLGGTEIQVLNLGRSRTRRDLAVFLPAEKVLFLSDTYLHRIFPFPSGGFPTEWVEAVKKAELIDATWYVPGHGFIDDAETMKSELTTFRRALEKVRAEGSRLYRSGVPVDEAAARADFGEFTSWSLRDRLAPASLRRVYAALNGELQRELNN